MAEAPGAFFSSLKQQAESVKQKITPAQLQSQLSLKVSFIGILVALVVSKFISSHNFDFFQTFSGESIDQNLAQKSVSLRLCPVICPVARPFRVKSSFLTPNCYLLLRFASDKLFLGGKRLIKI